MLPRQDRHAPDVTLPDQTFDVLPVEDLFDGQRLRRRLPYRLQESVVDGLQTEGKGSPLTRLDFPVSDVTKTAPGLLDHTIACHLTARIYAQYPERDFSPFFM
ncbi:MAG: hypothetical protein ACD_87C00279G0001 [uncultured bacterium]|nr:MAG: hypothetical protein ACD_87C00279G0001 [uncultured bacterium]